MLLKGDSIQVIAPSSSCPKEDLQKGLLYLKTLGYNPITKKNLLKSNGIVSNTTEFRVNHLQEALNSDSKIIWSVRGGYGSVHLLPSLSKMKKPKNQKVFIGYSDVTNLHVFFNQKWNWPSIYGPCVSRLGNGCLHPKEEKYLKEYFQRDVELREHSIKAFNEKANTVNKIKSKVCGGTLAMLASTVGTAFQLKTKSKILFLEEVGERGYQVDRMLQTLLLAGLFDSVSAVVLGDFTGGNEPSGKNFVNKVLKEFFADKNFPVFNGLKCGHGKINLPLAFNTETTIEKNKNFILTNKFPKL